MARRQHRETLRREQDLVIRNEPVNPVLPIAEAIPRFDIRRADEKTTTAHEYTPARIEQVAWIRCVLDHLAQHDGIEGTVWQLCGFDCAAPALESAALNCGAVILVHLEADPVPAECRHDTGEMPPAA